MTHERLTIVPCTLREANVFVKRHHRHNKPDRGCRATVAVALGEEVVGVAILGRPKSRMLQDGFTCEITRLATDGTRNACSKLYAQCWLIARSLGYRRLVTFTLPHEGGGSLRALKDLGFRLIEDRAGGGDWSRKDRPRVTDDPEQMKFRWEVSA